MEDQFEISAVARPGGGKGNSRRLRREGRVPAVVYGGSDKPASISLDSGELHRHLQHEAFYSHILSLKVNGKTERVVLRAIQRHPSKPVILHIDLMRIAEDQAITMNVPLHFVGEDVCVGVKTQGGIVNHLINDVEVSCLPKDLPEYVEVDISALELGASLHLSDIEPPPGVTLVALIHGEAADSAIVSVFKPRVQEEEEPEPVEGEEAAEGEEEAEAEESESTEQQK